MTMMAMANVDSGVEDVDNGGGSGDTTMAATKKAYTTINKKWGQQWQRQPMRTTAMANNDSGNDNVNNGGGNCDTTTAAMIKAYTTIN